MEIGLVVWQTFLSVWLILFGRKTARCGQLQDHNLDLGVFILLLVLHHGSLDNMLMDISYCQMKLCVGLTFLF